MRILFLASWFPYPPDNGSRQRTFYLLQGLARSHEVTLIAFYDPDQSPESAVALSELCRNVIPLPRRVYQPTRGRALAALFSPQPRFLADTFDPYTRDRIFKEFSAGTFDVVVASQLSMAVYAADLPHRARVFDEVEVGIFQDAYRNAAGLSRWRNALTWHKFARYLRPLASRFSALTVVSERERARLEEIAIGDERIHIVPNGVDCTGGAVESQIKEAFTLIYNGSITYHANLDAVRHLVRDILPLVRAVEPRARLKITGRADQVAQNELSEDNIVLFTGYVEDVRAEVCAAAVCVVPLRIGGGTRLKILEAMALGVPVVASSKAAEGLGLEQGKHLLVADTPQAFAQAILTLFQDAELRERLSRNAHDKVCAEFDWRIIQARFAQVVTSAAGLNLS